MPNSIAEMILALSAGAGQGYTAGTARRQATEEEQQRYLDEIARRREERAAAGQEAASARAEERTFREGEAKLGREERKREFEETKKFQQEKFDFEKKRTEDIDELKFQIRKQNLDAEEMQLRLMRTILDLSGKGTKADRDYLQELELKFLGDVQSNPDIKPEDAAARIKAYSDYVRALGAAGSSGDRGNMLGPPSPTSDFGGYILNEGTGVYEPSPTSSGPGIITKTAPWLQDLIDSIAGGIGGVATGRIFEEPIREFSKKERKKKAKELRTVE